MIITKYISVYIVNNNIKYYKSKGYDVKSFNYYDIMVEDLPINSKQIVDVKCDVCHKYITISYHSYTRNISNYGYYSCHSNCSKEKSKKTNLVKYGTEHPNQCENNKLARKEYLHNLSSDVKNQIFDKIKETEINTYGVDSYMKTVEFREKSKKTMIEKYGFAYAQQIYDIRENTNNTNLEKYGSISPLQNPKIVERIKNIKKERYGDENYNNRKQYKKTCITNFGVENPMKDKNIVNKLTNTFKDRYGVNHPSQVVEFYEKCMKSGYRIKEFRNYGIYYQGTYEYDFLCKYYDIITIERGKMISYTYKGKKKLYYPDFYIPALNLIVEIKSTRWYDKHKNLNIKKKTITIENGFNFIMILDKNYTKFDKVIKQL